MTFRRWWCMLRYGYDGTTVDEDDDSAMAALAETIRRGEDGGQDVAPGG